MLGTPSPIFAYLMDWRSAGEKLHAQPDRDANEQVLLLAMPDVLRPPLVPLSAPEGLCVPRRWSSPSCQLAEE
jgi:hypothetical protein